MVKQSHPSSRPRITKNSDMFPIVGMGTRSAPIRDFHASCLYTLYILEPVVLDKPFWSWSRFMD